MARNLFSSKRTSPWVSNVTHTCLGCKNTFRSEHAAAFHECENPPAMTTPAPVMKLVGFVNEMDEVVATHVDARTREFCDVAGLNLVFTIKARSHAEFLERAKVIAAHGTPAETSKLMSELLAMIGA